MRQPQKSILLCVLLLGSVCCEVIGRKEAVETFGSLKSSRLGNDLYLTLSIELKTGQDDHKVDRILQMLQDLFESLTNEKDQSINVRSEKRAFCLEKLSEIEYSIEGYQDKIDAGALTLPTLQQQQDEKKALLEVKKEEEGISQEQLNSLNLNDQAARQAYSEVLQDHENMLEALRRARTTISQLSVQSFLQKRKVVLAQIQEIGEGLKKQELSHRVGFLKILADLAQDVGVQADQQQVANIITIINELMEFEEATKRVELKAEQLRQARYEFDVTRFRESSERLDAELKDLKAKIVTLNTRIVELNNSIKELKQNLKAKQTQHELQDQSCNSDLAALDRQVEEYNELLDLVRKVILIFKSQTIDDIRDYVQ